jgi:hypothetical protein
MRVDGFLTRTGVFEYVNPDGSTRREYRPDAEVFDDEAMASFELVPVTDDHPPGMLNASNATQYAIGAVGERVRRDGEHVAASLMIFDAATVAKMSAGKVELSCGYDVELVNEPGETPDGQRYDAIQTKIRGNHVALVDRGRAGASARVRMDSAAVMLTDEGKAKMDEIQKLTERALKAEAEGAAQKQRADQLEQELASAKVAAVESKALADAADKARADALEGTAARVRARIELENAARAILGDKFRSDASDRELKVDSIESVDGERVDEGKSDDYVQALFDSCVKRSAKSKEDLSMVRGGAVPAVREDAEAKAYQEMIARNRAAYEAARKA